MASTTPAQSPTRRELPSAHPYAIKTTSTGILTRSNSSKAHGSWARHKYSPAPRSPSTFVFDPPNSSPSPSHRHTKSTSDVHASPSTKSQRAESPQRSERSTSMSPSPSKYSRSWMGKSPEGDRVKLPRHPYLWTPANLATYLSSELHDSEGEPLDLESIQRIVTFIQERKIGGRAFLSFEEEDFQEMDGVDQTWCDALWDASCTLRQETTPYRPSRISSSSYKRGRVRGIVGVFERSASESSDAGEEDIPNNSFRSTVLPPGLAPGKSSRQSRNRGWSVSESEDESTKSDWARARHDQSRRDSAASRDAETSIETESPLNIPSSTMEDEITHDDITTSVSEELPPHLDTPVMGENFTTLHPLETPQDLVLAPKESQNSNFESLEPDLPEDNTPHNREVEIVSLHARKDSEPTMAELYEQTYGVPPPLPSSHFEQPEDISDDDRLPGETVKIVAATSPAPPSPIARRPKASPPPPSLAQIFVPAPVPEQAGTTELQNIYVLPASHSDTDEIALRTLEALKMRLEVVERRLEAMGEKDIAVGQGGNTPALSLKVNKDVNGYDHDQRLGTSLNREGLWMEGGVLRSRQSAYILLAGAATGVSMVLIPLLFRHLWTR